MRVCTNPHIFFTYTLYRIVPPNKLNTIWGLLFGAISSYSFQSFLFLKKKKKRISTAIWARELRFDGKFI
jgi:hypothetical protein